ncbi:cytochrome c oxidase subunit 3 [Pelobacter seleniigenes]|uniref:cytochrome c oxidase subunit 3 n=1 Tax=Pelobacter seleniigenes TaxID=407188 RepID=UPI0004A6AD72|nr:cytochrome c oxidase subunit 3 [Pelobacter seleniigenes]
MMDKNKMAMLLFIASEVIFFLMLVIAYAFFHSKGTAGGAAGVGQLHIGKTSVYSIFLFASSFSVWRAGRSLPQNRRRGAFWLLLTIVLGAIFLVGQGLEYKDLLLQHITIGRSLFGTTFFTLTGFHGLHVFIGLLLLTILWCLAVFGRETEPAPTATESISLYWHFVDVVWVVIFAVVYLWAAL